MWCSASLTCSWCLTREGVASVSSHRALGSHRENSPFGQGLWLPYNWIFAGYSILCWTSYFHSYCIRLIYLFHVAVLWYYILLLVWSILMKDPYFFHMCLGKLWIKFPVKAFLWFLYILYIKLNFCHLISFCQHY